MLKLLIKLLRRLERMQWQRDSRAAMARRSLNGSA